MEKQTEKEEPKPSYIEKECRCCYPFYCGHKKIIMSRRDWKIIKLIIDKKLEAKK